jgi:hypothetical protein
MGPGRMATHLARLAKLREAAGFRGIVRDRVVPDSGLYQRGLVSFTAFGGHWSEAQPAIEVMARSEDYQTVLLAEYFWTQWPVGPGPIHAFVRPAR